MLRKHGAILVVLLLLGAVSLVYGSRALADLSVFDPAADVFEAKLILVPDTVIPGNQEVELVAARPVIARRLDKLGLDGPYNIAIRHGQLEVTLPKDRNTPYLAAVITSVGEIVFIDGGPDSPPVGEKVNIGVRAKPDDKVHQILFTSREVTEIIPPDAATGQIFYQLVLEPTAADRLANFSSTHPNSYLCMVMDEQILNCSSMYHQSGQTLEILPELSSGTTMSMTDLAVFLSSGPLSIRLKVVSD
jgi:preprotein translocase subunit SecD